MSGGYFDYQQYKIEEIADTLEEYLLINNREYSEKTLAKMRAGLHILRLAKIYAHRIDYLLEGDDGEETFHTRLEDDLDCLREREEFSNINNL